MVAARLTTAVLRYGAAQVAANAAMLRGAGAARALHGALALVGGPLGLLVGAAGLLYAFREELGLVDQEAHTTAQRIQQLTQSIATMSATDLTRNLEAARMEMRFLSDQGQNLRNVLRNMGPGDTWDGRTYEELRQQMNRSRGDAGVARDTVRELESALDRVMNPGTPNIPELPGITPDPIGGEDAAGGTGITDEQSEEELKRLREHLAQRLEIIRESLMNEQELEVEHHANRMDELAEIREQEMLTEDEYRKMKEEAELQHLQRLRDMEERTAAERANIEKRHADTVVGMRRNVVQQSVALLDMFAGESKAAAIASIALQKGLAIAQTIMQTQVAKMRALAELGPIAGPPMAAKIGALGAASVGIIAAQGLAQAASVKNTTFGGGATTGGSTGGGGTNAISQGPQQPEPQQQPTTVNVNLVGGDEISRANARTLVKSEER